MNLLKGLRLTVKSGDIHELLTTQMEQMDESYELNILVDTDEIHVSANQYVGLVRGLATVHQMIKPSSTQKGLYSIYGLPLTIKDAPRYPYRGFMLDTARHYFSNQTIKELIETLSAAKFSVLHWHIVDDESFPLHLDSAPDLAQYGAFSA